MKTVLAFYSGRLVYFLPFGQLTWIWWNQI